MKKKELKRRLKALREANERLQNGMSYLAQIADRQDVEIKMLRQALSDTRFQRDEAATMLAVIYGAVGYAQENFHVNDDFSAEVEEFLNQRFG